MERFHVSSPYPVLQRKSTFVGYKPQRAWEEKYNHERG